MLARLRSGSTSARCSPLREVPPPASTSANMSNIIAVTMALTLYTTPTRFDYVVSLDPVDVARMDGLLPEVGAMMVCWDGGAKYDLVTVLGENGYILTLDVPVAPRTVCAFGARGSDRVRHLTVHARVGGR